MRTRASVRVDVSFPLLLFSACAATAAALVYVYIVDMVIVCFYLFKTKICNRMKPKSLSASALVNHDHFIIVSVSG